MKIEYLGSVLFGCDPVGHGRLSVGAQDSCAQMRAVPEFLRRDYVTGALREVGVANGVRRIRVYYKNIGAFVNRAKYRLAKDPRRGAMSAT